MVPPCKITQLQRNVEHHFGSIVSFFLIATKYNGSRLMTSLHLSLLSLCSVSLCSSLIGYCAKGASYNSSNFKSLRSSVGSLDLIRNDSFSTRVVESAHY